MKIRENILKAPAFTFETLKKHLRQYPGLGRLINFKKLEGGVANYAYKVKTTKGYFILKIAVRNNPHRVKYEVELLNKIKKLPTPKLIKAQNDRYLVLYEKHQTMLYKYLQGYIADNIDEKMAYEIGVFLGKLHIQTENFNSKISRVKLYSITEKKINYTVKAGKNISNQKIKKAISLIKRDAFKYKLPRSLPNGAMHLDISPSNVLFSGKKLTGVVDFDNSYKGPLVLDLGGALVWFGYSNGRFDFAKLRSLYKGYMTVRELGKEEKSALLGAMHCYIFGIVLHGVEFYIQKKLSEAFLTKVSIGHLLNAGMKLGTLKKKFESSLEI
ncbi:MAG: phosphotransferase [Patescibacteria group bacterium]